VTCSQIKNFLGAKVIYYLQQKMMSDSGDKVCNHQPKVTGGLASHSHSDSSSLLFSELTSEPDIFFPHLQVQGDIKTTFFFFLFPHLAEPVTSLPLKLSYLTQSKCSAWILLPRTQGPRYSGNTVCQKQVDRILEKVRNCLY
jgi:hypothetical protein